MKRSVAIYAVLLVAALLGAYLTWTAEPATEAATGTTVARFEREAIDQLVWETDAKVLRLDVRSDDRGRYVWVEETRKSNRSESAGSADRDGGESSNDPADTGTSEVGTDASRSDTVAGDDSGEPDAAGGPAATEQRGSGDSETAGTTEPGSSDGNSASETTDSYLASDAVEQIFEQIAPVRADREVSVESDDRRAAYGFDEPKGTLTVRTSDGGDRSFTVGGYAYGRRHVYVRDDSDDRYFVVDAGLVRPFLGPSRRLKQREVVDTERRAVERILLRGDEESAELVHHHPDDPAASYWSLGEEDEKSPTARSWVDKLMRLRLDAYVTGERPADLQRAAVVELRTRSGPETRLELFRARGDGAGAEFYAESTFTRSLVRLRNSSASTLFSDIRRLLEGDVDTGEPAQPSPRRKGASPGSRQKGRPPGGLPRDRGTGRPSQPPASAPSGE